VHERRELDALADLFDGEFFAQKTWLMASPALLFPTLDIT